MIEQLLIRCNYCENCWKVDEEPQSCTCDYDNDWELIIVRFTDE